MSFSVSWWWYPLLPYSNICHCIFIIFALSLGQKQLHYLVNLVNFSAYIYEQWNICLIVCLIYVYIYEKIWNHSWYYFYLYSFLSFSWLNIFSWWFLLPYLIKVKYQWLMLHSSLDKLFMSFWHFLLFFRNSDLPVFFYGPGSYMTGQISLF